ncbi:helix-turn-helix domain-containing protein [Neomegalonema sp.]|uniref:helix-turn-helix domain-containing protein n=1 Tax=Neomegalonema sp. TaxID=2039713 RepID=UPI002635AE1C|nr:helix-turn-helix transcriptional regulator [Neomegalonema sp.]MDD2870117.1 helix-turn-helix transcriptional regulator [Neomegalonema sp.]
MDEKDKSDPVFAQRIEQISKMVGGPGELARKSGLSRRVIDKYIAAGSDPSRQRLISLATAAGVSVQWLATGEGERIPHPSPVQQETSPPPPLDGWLLSRAIDGVRRIYKRVGGQISTINEVELGLEVHNRITALVDGQEGRHGALVLALDQLEKDLRAAAKTESDEGKRTA